jgi:DNA invertase Pin-like site-specific DNA recombinase
VRQFSDPSLVYAGDPQRFTYFSNRRRRTLESQSRRYTFRDDRRFALLACAHRADTARRAASLRSRLVDRLWRARAACLALQRRSFGVIVRSLALPPFRPRSAGSRSFFLTMPSVYVALHVLTMPRLQGSLYALSKEVNPMMVIPTSRVGIYARVSASDKDQNPATQLLPLREFVTTRGWTVAGEFVDHASAMDLRGRTAWRNLLDQASKRRVDLVLVWRIDRAFRSVHDAADTLERFRGWSVGLRSYCEPWLDTTSPFGEIIYYITIAYARLEQGIISERVKAGMDQAKREGKTFARPRAVNGTYFVQGPNLLGAALIC